MLHPTKSDSRQAREAPVRRQTQVHAVAFAALALLLAASTHAQVFVTQMSPPPDGAYDRTLALHFTATFSGPIVVQGSPQLTLRVGNQVRHATWMPPLGPSPAATSLTFVYHPEPLDRDEDGITLLPELDLNGGAIQGMDTLPARLSFAPPDTRGVRVYLHPPPTPRIMGLTSGTGITPPRAVTGDAFLLCGTADGGSRVTVSLAGVGVIGATTAVPNGAWSLPYPRSLLSAGTYQLTAIAQDAWGLPSAPSTPLELKIQSGATNPATR